jgi:hypothetical protein
VIIVIHSVSLALNEVIHKALSACLAYGNHSITEINFIVIIAADDVIVIS